MHWKRGIDVEVGDCIRSPKHGELPIVELRDHPANDFVTATIGADLRARIARDKLGREQVVVDCFRYGMA